MPARVLLTPATITPDRWSYEVGTPGVWTGNPADAKHSRFHDPVSKKVLYLDPALKAQPTSTVRNGGVLTCWDCCVDACFDVGAVCGLIFELTDSQSDADWRVYYRRPQDIYNLSRSFGTYPAGLGSDNWTVNPVTLRDWFIGNVHKRGSLKAGQILHATAVKHEFLRCFMYAHGNKSVYAGVYPDISWSSPLISADFLYPWSYAGRIRWGYGASSASERITLGQKHGPNAWLYQFQLGLPGER
jgi:hypothetical protein